MINHVIAVVFNPIARIGSHGFYRAYIYIYTLLFVLVPPDVHRGVPVEKPAQEAAVQSSSGGIRHRRHGANERLHSEPTSQVQNGERVGMATCMVPIVV